MDAENSASSPYWPQGFKCGGVVNGELAEALLTAANQARDERARQMPDEAAALRVLHSAYTRLKELGWRVAIYAPVDKPLLVIEAGSIGIHRGYRDSERCFWVDDAWPSSPILFKEG
jgi:hypothetical protein